MTKPQRLQNPALLRQVSGGPCVVCRKPSDAAHIRGRGAGGDDEPNNVMPLCREHHSLQHALGWVTMAERHPAVFYALHQRGWEIVIQLGVRKLVKR